MSKLENAKKFFSEATSSSIIAVDDDESTFYHKLAEMIPNTIDAYHLVLAIKIALNDEERRHANIMPYISLIPIYVDRYAKEEFANEFRKLFVSEVLGLSQEQLPEVDYGINEISDGLIDISDKDKYEVFCALYNASTPIGMGFAQYNPMTLTPDMAKMAFEQVGERVANNGIRFGYVLGRPLKCTIYPNRIDVKNYNYHNGKNMGQKAIRTVKNISEKKKEDHTKKRV